jgi:acetyl-CoA carboxylase biotin carboxyl carrier protein
LIHYHLPLKEDEFIHRNGRTARMKASGTAYIITHESEKKMEYLDYGMDVLKVDSASALPKPPEFQTIYISGGKKNKLNKIDIVGFFSQKGKLEKGDFKVNIRHGAATVQVAQQAPVYQAMPSAPAPAPAPSAAPAAPKAEAPAPSADNLITIKSPMIGTFYRSAGPGKPTFVNVGDDIKAGQVLCIIEAMKLFNEIESEMSGTIVKVLVEDGTSVEYDQPLFLVQP